MTQLSFNDAYGSKKMENLLKTQNFYLTLKRLGGLNHCAATGGQLILI